MSDNHTSMGITGIGRAGQVLVELHEALPPAAEAWRLLVEFPGVHLTVRLASPSQVSAITTFLAVNLGKTKYRQVGPEEQLSEGTRLYTLVDELDLGPLTIAKDGEQPDRFIVGVTGPDHHLGFDLHDPLVRHLIEALKDLERDLEM